MPKKETVPNPRDRAGASPIASGHPIRQPANLKGSRSQGSICNLMGKRNGEEGRKEEQESLVFFECPI
jgi:hypothetical protein